jgi:acyl carrier protein
MNGKKQLKDPYILVAEAIELERKQLDENSAMGITQNWDSLNHMDVIVDIEESYGIQIPNDAITKYNNLKAIIALYNELSGNLSISQKIKKFLKNFPIVRIFFK